MKTLSKLTATAVLLAALAMLPGTVVAFRMMCDGMAAAAPTFDSPVAEADYWARAFGP